MLDSYIKWQYSSVVHNNICCGSSLCFCRWMWKTTPELSSNTHLIWAATRKNQQSDCAPSEDSDHPGHPPSLRSLATYWANSQDSDQTGRMPRLIGVFARRTLILLSLACHGSFVIKHSVKLLKIRTPETFAVNNKIWKRWRYHRLMGPTDVDGMAHSVYPDQTASLGAVWSGSTLFAQELRIITVRKCHMQYVSILSNTRRKQFTAQNRSIIKPNLQYI